MGFFSRYSHKEVIYLTPVQVGDEQLPKDKIRILHCDAKGNIESTVIENSVYQLARSYVEELESAHKHCAILSAEISPGKSVPYAIEVSSEQVYALDSILEHALRTGKMPDILKRYPKEIIRLGEGKRKELRAQYEQARIPAVSRGTPEVLQRLADYPEGGIDVAIPIYKAEYHYPLIILKRLPQNEQTQPNEQRLLILDNDGDLAIIRVPLEIIDEAEKNLEEWKRENNSDGCILYSRHSGSLIMSHMELNEFQRIALDIITRHFEETGRGERPISRDAQAVLAKAKAVISSGHEQS